MDSNQCFRWNKQWLLLSACLVSLCPLSAAAEGGMFGNLRTNVQEDPAFASSTYFNSNQSVTYQDNQLQQDDFQANLTANANPSETPYDMSSADNNDTNEPIAYNHDTYGQDRYPQENDATWMAQDANNGQFSDVNGEGPLYFSMDQLNENFQNPNSTSLADNNFSMDQLNENFQNPNSTSLAGDISDTRSWPPAASSEVADGSWNNDIAEDIWSYSDDGSSCCSPQCCWGNFRIFGDFLYWNLCQNNLDYAVCARDVSGVPIASSSGLVVPLWFQGNYKIRSVSTKYKPGFRVGGFYSSLCSSWELGLVYTHLNSSYCNRSRARSNTSLVLPSQLPQTADVAELLFRNQLIGDSPRAHSKFHLHYNMLDVLLTTSYCNEGCLTWQPYIGARFLEIKQKWNVRYAYSTEVSSLPFRAVSATSRYHSKLPTGGLTVGVGGAYNICGCWNVIGRVGASCVGGTAKQCTRLNAVFDTSSSSAAYDPTRVGKRKCAILTGFEGALGIAYTLECCKLGVQLGVGYEFQTWLNVPSPIEHGVAVPGIRHNPSSNFTLHGLFVRAGVSF